MRAVANLRGGDDPGLTAREWARELGRCCDWTRERLGELKARGKLVVGKRMGEDLAGRPREYTVYRLKQDAPRVVREDDLEHVCGDCGSALDAVRPGKWQCARCG